MQRQAKGFDVELHDRLHDYAMLAVQGPDARALVAGLTDGELPKRFRTATRTVAGAAGVLVCGTGYTGEDGVELLIAPERAATVWDAVVAGGATPAGLGARDTLRLEVCFHLYGNDLMEERGPIEAGLGWCCKEDTGFIGSDAVRAIRDRGPAERLVAFAMTGPGIARQGNPVAGGGEVTSGTMSPCLGVGIGMAYVPAGRAEPGTPLEIDVRGKARTAEVRAKPLYTKES
jgi:aminomethyltransferase